MAEIFNADSTTEDVLKEMDLSGKSVLITGVSAGLGIETARSLVARGAHVTGTVRSITKAGPAVAPVQAAARAGKGTFSLAEMELASLESVRNCAAILLEEGLHYDLIIANAGVMGTPFERTVEGFELQFGTNYIGHFVFVNGIASLISDGGRIVILSSAGHYLSDVDLDDPNYEHTEYNPWLAYARSKTACILFAVELDRRYQDKGIRATAVHPGTIKTELQRHYSPAQQADYIELTKKNTVSAESQPLKWKSVEQGAATSVWAAVKASGEEIGGRYCHDCCVAEVDKVGIPRSGVRDYALNASRARLLWDVTLSLLNKSR